MLDPIRIKNKTEVCVDTVHYYKDAKTPLRLFKIESSDFLQKIGHDQYQKYIQRELPDISPTSVMGIYNSAMRFSYADENALNDFDYANLLVETHLPYCLHIPNHYEMEVNIPEEGLRTLVIFHKIWTHKAPEKEENSSRVDFFAQDRTIHFQKSSIVSPPVPVNPEHGWSQNFTGKNIEKIKDQNGQFRYSKIFIQFDHNISQQELKQDKDKESLKNISEKALMVVNRLLDCYRSVTNLPYLERLGTLNINMIYFIDHKLGYYILAPGIQAAPMNRSKNEILKIENMLEKGEKPNLYRLITLDTISSFDKKEYTLAVVKSFQGLEIFLENLLYSGLKKRGSKENEISSYLARYWRTKERLKECLKDLKGTCLYDSNTKLWDQWCTLYDQTRNEVIHKGKEVSEISAKETIGINFQIIEWLKSI